MSILNNLWKWLFVDVEGNDGFYSSPSDASDSTEQSPLPKRKRGRPFGSKNKRPRNAKPNPSKRTGRTKLTKSHKREGQETGVSTS